jgi:hypothetical protein
MYTELTGLGGDTVAQPEGGVPVFVEKFHEPPLGVEGAVADSIKMNHSK